MGRVTIHTPATVHDEAGLSRQRAEKVEGFGIGGRQRTGRMMPIGQVEVEPEPRHDIGGAIFAALKLARLAGWALQRNAEV